MSDPTDAKSYKSQLDRIIDIVAALRGPNGCPWDKEQTHESLKPFLIEESYEVLDAIDHGTKDDLREELGDVLLQVILHAQLATDDHHFNIEDVAHDISEKMVRRHPHVFGDESVSGSEDVKTNWEAIKHQEKKNTGKELKSVLDSVVKHQPALTEAFQISKKAVKQGFEWQQPIDVFDKVVEEINEAKEAAENNDNEHLEEEFGDLFFTMVNLCRVYKINPELALKKANHKFRQRFVKMEDILGQEHKDLKEVSFEKWNDTWKSIK